MMAIWGRMGKQEQIKVLHVMQGTPFKNETYTD
jgi:hypothetical protein